MELEIAVVPKVIFNEIAKYKKQVLFIRHGLKTPANYFLCSSPKATAICSKFRGKMTMLDILRDSRVVYITGFSYENVKFNFDY